MLLSASRAVIFLSLGAALEGCTTTTVLESENPSKNRPPQWADYWTLPVLVQGSIPGLPQKRLAALFGSAADSSVPHAGTGRRIEMFVNPASRPPNNVLCSDTSPLPTRAQHGAYAYVVGALCNGGSPVTFATADILTKGLAPDQLKGNLEMMHLQLWQALTYGNNHPELVHPSWMYGP